MSCKRDPAVGLFVLFLAVVLDVLNHLFNIGGVLRRDEQKGVIMQLSGCLMVHNFALTSVLQIQDPVYVDSLVFIHFSTMYTKYTVT